MVTKTVVTVKQNVLVIDCFKTITSEETVLKLHIPFRNEEEILQLTN